MRIPTGVTTTPIHFVAVDPTNTQIRETGLTGFTVYRSRNGAVAVAMTTPTIVEIDAINMPGVYSLLLDEDMEIGVTSTSEEMALHITQVSMASVTTSVEIYRPAATLDAGQDAKLTQISTEVQFIERWVHVDTEQLIQGIGTQAAPFNTWDAAVTYMEANNLLRVHTVSDLTLDRRTKNFVIVGVGNPIIDFNDQNLDGSEFRDCTLKGLMTGVITADNCDLFDNVQVQGRIRRCAFLGTVDQTGSTNYEGCYSGVKGHDYPTLKVTGGDAGLRGFIGSINVTGVTSGEHSIGISTDGRIIVDAACTGGHVHLRGFPFEIIDNSDIGCLVFDETESQKGRELHEASFNRRKHDSGLNTITIYESDDVTPKHVFDTNADLSDITPQ